MTDRKQATADARHLLFAGLVDYAGLFPPAALPMIDAVQRYDEYRRGPHAWALGTFVVPVARLSEFEAAAAPFLRGGETWKLAVIAGGEFAADIQTIESFSRRAAPRAVVAAIEVKASALEQVETIARSAALLRTNVSDPFELYVEVPIAGDPSPLLQSIAAHGLRAKVRTGGVERGAFPDPDRLAAFLVACVRLGVTFKATAGLHHAVRGRYPLTYDPASEQGTMFGFLNVFLAALFARAGAGPADTQALLEERDARSFTFSESAVSWRGRSISASSIREARANSAISFGSCSFAEPVADLSSLGLL